VESGQREGRRSVIESRRRPIRRRVADRAILREAGRNVVRHRSAKRRGAVPIRGMAGVAGSRWESVVVAHVTRNASPGEMRPSKRESGCAVIPGRGRERCYRGRVAGAAVRRCECRKCRRDRLVRRSSRALPSRQVAA